MQWLCTTTARTLSSPATLANMTLSLQYASASAITIAANPAVKERDISGWKIVRQMPPIK